VIENNNNNNSGNNFGSDNHKEDNDEVCEAEDEVVEDLLEKYKKMKEEIQCEWLVSHMFFLSTYPLCTGTHSHHENTSIEEKTCIYKTYG